MRVFAPSLPTWRDPREDLEVGPYTEIVSEFLGLLKIGKVAVAGNSMGGWIALSLVERNKDLVDILILEDSAGISSTNFDLINRAGIPVLIIWGSDDETISMKNGMRFHRKIETSTLVCLNGVGHVPHWEKPEEFNRLVLDFIKQAKEKGSK
jgi:pimeloyl-ACP methyl ester carboxylesterase